MNTTRLTIFFLICTGLINICFAATPSYTTAWSYTGDRAPQFWGKLDPTYHLCSTGKNQSPIDINQYFIAKKSGLKINYQPAPLNIIFDGLTQLNIHGEKTIINDGHTIQINFPKNGPKELLGLNGETYTLVQLHLHTPSETHINGQVFPLEIHFVNQSHSGNVAVVAVLMQQGNANPALANILSHVPTVRNQLSVFPNDTIDLSALLPKNHAYYSFQGSLTTPPCSEGLQWLVMQYPIEASAQQIAQFQKIIGGKNARPIQPLNNRKVFFYSGI